MSEDVLPAAMHMASASDDMEMSDADRLVKAPLVCADDYVQPRVLYC
jgi:hypothetical protein